MQAINAVAGSAWLRTANGQLVLFNPEGVERHTAPRVQHFNQMTSLVCLLSTVLVLFTIPVVILWRLTVAKQQHAKWLCSKGWTFKAIADHYGCSPSTAQRWATV